MKGCKIEFLVYAESEEEAALASKAMQDFVNEHGQAGRAVTAVKIAEAVKGWKDNSFVKNRIIKYFEQP